MIHTWIGLKSFRMAGLAPVVGRINSGREKKRKYVKFTKFDFKLYWDHGFISGCARLKPAGANVVDEAQARLQG